MVNQHVVRRSNESAKLILWCVAPLFGAIIAAGWNKLLLVSAVIDWPWVPRVLGVLLAITAIGLAKGIAEERFVARDKIEDGAPDRTWMAYVFVLFLISALGTMNTLYYYGEGRVILSETIDDTRNTMTRFNVEVAKILRNTKLEEKQATVNRLLTKLEAEIINPNGGETCGVGPNASNTINEITAVLPGFAKFSSGKAYKCDQGDRQFAAIVQGYKDQAQRLLRNDLEYVNTEYEKKAAFINAVNIRVNSAVGKLDAAKAALAGNTKQKSTGAASVPISEQNDSELNDAYDVAKQAIENAAVTYGELKINLEQISGVTSALPPKIDTATTRQLGAIMQIVPLILSRWNHFSSWVVLLVAVAADVTLIMLFARVVKADLISTKPNEKKVDKSDPGEAIMVLWTNKSLAESKAERKL